MMEQDRNRPLGLRRRRLIMIIIIIIVIIIILFRTVIPRIYLSNNVPLINEKN
jgi:hypothetical protein